MTSIIKVDIYRRLITLLSRNDMTLYHYHPLEVQQSNRPRSRIRRVALSKLDLSRQIVCPRCTYSSTTSRIPSKRSTSMLSSQQLLIRVRHGHTTWHSFYPCSIMLHLLRNSTEPVKHDRKILKRLGQYNYVVGKTVVTEGFAIDDDDKFVSIQELEGVLQRNYASISYTTLQWNPFRALVL